MIYFKSDDDSLILLNNSRNPFSIRKYHVSINQNTSIKNIQRSNISLFKSIFCKSIIWDNTDQVKKVTVNSLIVKEF